MTVQYIDRAIRLPSSPAQTVRCLVGPHDRWLMLDSERATLAALLAELKPQCAVEVGIYHGGSLGVVAAHSTKVYALDIDPAYAISLEGRYSNVEFITGPSADTLPALLERLQADGQAVDFVLIDADHSAAGIRGDIESVLRYRPTERPLYVVMHDSFNPGCRRGMTTAAWAANPHVHAVEIDFVVGSLGGTDEPVAYRQMWCGLALGILLPEIRTGELVIHERERLLFHTALRRSVYPYQKWWNPLFSVPRLADDARRGVGSLMRAHVPMIYGALRSLRDRVHSRSL
jgi:hypothetical protein